MFDSLRPRRTFYVVEWRLATHEGVRRDHDWRSLSATSARFPLLGLPTRWKGTGFEAFDPETGECLIRRNFTALEDFHGAERLFERWKNLSRDPGPFAGNYCLLWACQSRSLEAAPRDLVGGRGNAAIMLTS
jgi:hypothetical protein